MATNYVIPAYNTGTASTVGDVVTFNNTSGSLINDSTTPVTQVPKYFGASGFIASPKVWIGSTTTNGTGDWTISISSASFTTVIAVVAEGVLNTTTATSNVLTTLKTVSTTTITGRLVTGVVLLVLGATMQNGPTGATVYVTVFGT
jgi:hypothetical protein